MSNKPINPDRRKASTTATALIGGIGIGIGAVATPFFQSMQPSAKAMALGADIEVDISKLKPGQLMIVEWRRKPVGF